MTIPAAYDRGLRDAATLRGIREFCSRIGVSTVYNVVEVGVLEDCVRDHLNRTAQRVMAVMDPIKIVITNYSPL